MESQGTLCWVPLRWGDCDRYGHVNNVLVMRVLEEARVVAFREWFGPAHTLLDEGVVVTWHRVEYLAEMPYQAQPLAARVWTSEVKAAQFTINYELFSSDADDATQFVRARTGLATYDVRAGHPRRLAPEERACVLAAAGEPLELSRG